MPVPELPPSGLAIRRAVEEAVAASAAADEPALRRAVGALLAADDSQVRAVLHELVLRLVERAFPDGLDADDARDLVTRVAGWAAGWLAQADTYPVALILGGALSVHEEELPVAPDALLTAAAVTVDRLLAGEPPRRWLDEAFAELRRAETIELP